MGLKSRWGKSRWGLRADAQELKSRWGLRADGA